MSNTPRSALTACSTVILILTASADVSGIVQDPTAAVSFDRSQGFRAELVALRFAERVEGSNRSIYVNEERTDDYRLGVATIKIEKPEGVEITLACADITLHYYHSGDVGEVTPCQGLSNFSTVLNTDREFELRSANSGPGFLKKTTRSAATSAATVYIEAMFSGMEPSTKEAWIAVGHVDASAPLVTEGWKVVASASCSETLPIPLNSSEEGSWASSCQSSHRSGRYARFFTFSLSSAGRVRIDLDSGEDTFLYLIRGSGPSGELIASDDDGGGGTSSRIERQLEPGTYTIEATTYESGVSGRFTIRLGAGGG